MLPILERLQVGDQKQSYQGLYYDIRRRRFWPQYLGQNNCGAKWKDHSEKTKYSGRRLCEDSCWLAEATQVSVLNVRHCFVKNTPLFLTLSRKICFTAVNHLANRTVPQIFTAFKEIYQYYPHLGFHITTVHSDGEFTPLQDPIESLPGGPMINLSSANEHVPDIKRKIRAVKERCWAAWHGLPN